MQENPVFKRECKLSRNKAWQSFCNGLNRFVKIGDIWKSVKRLENKKTAPSVPVQEGDWSESENLFNSLYPPYVMQENPVFITRIQDNNTCVMNSTFSMEERTGP
jgi:hypothetical protein